MAESSTQQYTHKDVDEQRFKLGIGYFLLLVEPLHEQIAQGETDEPAKRIPADGQRTEVESCFARAPNDV